jgi:hypothetical protein
MFNEPGTAREEAERLVAAVLSAVAMAANAHPEWSTGSAECCVCPLCKVIAAVRDPDPEVVERMATGAGDLAAGMASFLRNLGGEQPKPDSGPEPAPDSKAWEKATAEPPKKVVKKAVRKKTES